MTRQQISHHDEKKEAQHSPTSSSQTAAQVNNYNYYQTTEQNSTPEESDELQSLQQATSLEEDSANIKQKKLAARNQKRCIWCCCVYVVFACISIPIMAGIIIVIARAIIDSSYNCSDSVVPGQNQTTIMADNPRVFTTTSFRIPTNDTITDIQIIGPVSFRVHGKNVDSIVAELKHSSTSDTVTPIYTVYHHVIGNVLKIEVVTLSMSQPSDTCENAEVDLYLPTTTYFWNNVANMSITASTPISRSTSGVVPESVVSWDVAKSTKDTILRHLHKLQVKAHAISMSNVAATSMSLIAQSTVGCIFCGSQNLTVSAEYVYTADSYKMSTTKPARAFINARKMKLDNPASPATMVLRAKSYIELSYALPRSTYFYGTLSFQSARGGRFSQLVDLAVRGSSYEVSENTSTSFKAKVYKSGSTEAPPEERSTIDAVIETPDGDQPVVSITNV